MVCYMLLPLILASLTVDARKFYIHKRGSDITLVQTMDYSYPKVGLSTLDDCKCRCKQLHSNLDWVCCKCAWTDEVCFPGDARVQLQTGESVPMTTLKIGQKVLTMSAEGSPIFTEVLTFLKRYPGTDAVYTVLRTERGSIRMTPRHIVFMASTNDTSQRQPRFAQDASIGDYLFTATGSALTPAKIVAIDSEIMEGVYVPLTETGTLVVDGMLASCYSSINHHVAHAFLTPVRWFPALFHIDADDHGMPRYVAFLKWLAHTLLPASYQGQYEQKRSEYTLTKDWLMQIQTDL